MKILVCGYGQFHFSRKCNCWKKSEKVEHPRYVLSQDFASLPPGKYNVTAHPVPGQIKLELKPVKR